MEEQLEEKETFKSRLKYAAEEGLLIFTKWALVLLLIYLGLNFTSGIIGGSQNGTQSAILLNQLQQKGYLPKVGPDGIVPDKPVEEVVKNEKTTP